MLLRVPVVRSLLGAAVVNTFGSGCGMFEAAVSKFVKTVGKESLIPVPNLDEANKCQPFQVRGHLERIL